MPFGVRGTSGAQRLAERCVLFGCRIPANGVAFRGARDARGSSQNAREPFSPARGAIANRAEVQLPVIDGETEDAPLLPLLFGGSHNWLILDRVPGQRWDLYASEGWNPWVRFPFIGGLASGLLWAGKSVWRELVVGVSDAFRQGPFVLLAPAGSLSPSLLSLYLFVCVCASVYNMLLA